MTVDDNIALDLKLLYTNMLEFSSLGAIQFKRAGGA